MFYTFYHINEFLFHLYNCHSKYVVWHQRNPHVTSGIPIYNIVVQNKYTIKHNKRRYIYYFFLQVYFFSTHWSSHIDYLCYPQSFFSISCYWKFCVYLLKWMFNEYYALLKAICIRMCWKEYRKVHKSSKLTYTVLNW